MNRIYQGRVTKVEILNGKNADGQPQELPNWQSALWQHHELFQDAVNYYTLALAAMAGGLRPADDKARENEIKRLNDELDSLAQHAKKAKEGQEVKDRINRLVRENAIWQWREQVRKAWEEGVERGAQRFEWKRETLARMLKKLDPSFDALKAGFDACCDVVLKLSNACPAQCVEALLYLLELAGGRTDLSPLVESKLPWLCNPSSADLTDDATKSKRRRAAQEAARCLTNADSGEFASLAKEFDPALLVTKWKLVKGEAARKGLREAFELAVKRQEDAKTGKVSGSSAKLASHKDVFEKCLATLPDDFAVNVAAGKHQREYRFAAVLRAVFAGQDNLEKGSAEVAALRAAAIESFRLSTKNLAGKDVELA